MYNSGGLTIVDIGMRLREARLRQKLSLAEVAERSGLSASFISNVERGINDPTIGSLQAILGALGMSMADLFRAPSCQRVVRRNERLQMVTADGGKVLYELITPPGEKRIEGMLLVVQPGAGSGLVPHSHRGVEVGLILRGRLRYWLGDEVYDLEEGDSITYEATIPHRYANEGDEECVSLWVLAHHPF